VRPVDVSAAPVVGAADPYNSVSPAAMVDFGGKVPVAEAVAVNLAVLPQEATGASSIPLQPEVRKAEAAGVGTALQSEQIDMGLPAPPPIRF
jgi:hypothetical protein